MRGLTTVLGRELRERWPVPVAALGAGMLALAAPLLPAARLHTPDEARAGAAVIFALAFGLGTALMLGGSILASDFFERRVGFYLARPLSPLSIWGGKMAAALLLAAGGALLALLPSAIVGASLRDAALGLIRSRQTPALLAAALLLVPLAHVGAVLLRSRSPLLLADLAALGAATLVARAVYLEFLPHDALGVLLVSLGLLAAGVAAGVLAAGPVQLAQGRADLRRGRLALSVVLWSGCALGIVTALGWRAWLLSAGPGDVAVHNARPAPEGHWMVIWGRTAWRAGYSPTFLVNTSTDAALRTPGETVFSGDGRRAAWLESEDPRSRARARLVLAELGPDGLLARRTSVFVHGFAGLLLDASGSRVAVFEGGSLSVFDASGRQLLSIRREGLGWGTKAMFLSNDRVRVWSAPWWNEGKPSPVEVFEIDVPRKRVSILGRSEPLVVKPPFLADAAGERFLLRSGRDGIELRDGRTAGFIALLAEKREDALSADFLPDGRIAAVRAAEGGLSLRLFSRDGAPIREIPLVRGHSASLSGMAAPGVLLATVSDEEIMGRSSPTRVLTVDIVTEVVRPVAQDLRPAARYGRFVDRDPTRVVRPESPVSRLFYGAAGSLVLLDPVSGTQRTVLPGNPRAFAP